MGSIYPRTFDIRRVAIVGAGPSGLAAAKYLTAQAAYDQVTIFEQQAEVGGVWNYNTVVPAPNPIPQTSPFYPPDEPAHPGGGGGGSGRLPVFPSPMYNDLHANIPKTIMRFSDLAFPEESWIFPSRYDVQDHIVRYAQDVRHLIRFCTRVTNITLRSENNDDRWHVEAQSTTVGDDDDEEEGQVALEVFDAVVVANGHYSIPFVPSIDGIAAFHQKHPDIIIHSKNYHSADTFRGKKTIIVGNGPSGLDIAYQVHRVCSSRGQQQQQQTLLSVRHATPAEKLAHIGCREIAEIERFLPDERRGVLLKDGRTETDIDAVVFCTGFRYSLPFLRGLEKDHHLLTNGACVHGLYKHLFHIQHPTLVFPTLNMGIVPFPFAEAQAAVFSAVWSNDLELPPRSEMVRWNRDAEEAAGDKLHVLPQLRDGEYMNEMSDWASRAAHLGKEPPKWGHEEFWLRRIIGDAKLVFEKQGCQAKSLEELGFRYDPEQNFEP